jgi:hypothetical protein
VLTAVALALVAALVVAIQWGNRTTTATVADKPTSGQPASQGPGSPDRVYTDKELTAAAGRLVAESMVGRVPPVSYASGRGDFTGLLVHVTEQTKAEHGAAQLAAKYSSVVGMPIDIAIGDPPQPAVP